MVKYRLVFDKTIEIAQSLGLIRKHTNQRVDATYVISHVNRIPTTDLLFRAVRCVVEEIEKKAPEIYKVKLAEYLKERYGNRFSSFGMSKEKRQERMAEIIEDGRVLKSVVEQHLQERVSEGIRFHGLRYARFRGEAGHQLQFYFAGAAVNLKRLTKVIGEQMNIATNTS